MLGGKYLETRDTLIELIRYTRALAKRSSTELEEGEDSIEDGLSRAFRVICLGERGAGKTSFMEKLLDASLRELNKRESSIAICRNMGYRVFEEREDSCEKIYSLELKEFEVVEIDSAESLEASEEGALNYLFERADFVFWLLPAENPWVASTWDSIERWQQFVRHKSAILLHQIDKRTAADVPMLLGHVKELAKQRGAESSEMLAVSSTRGSGVEECQSLLDRALNRSLDRRRDLRMVHRQVSALLKRIEENVDDRSRNLAGDQEYLQSIEAQIDRSREQEVLKVKEDLPLLGKLLRSQIKRIMRHARLRTGTIATHLSLFGKGNVAATIETFVVDKVVENAESYAKAESEKMRLDCRAQWGEIRPHLENRLEVEVGDFDEESFDDQGEVFTEGMGKATRQVLVHLKLRRFLNALLREHYAMILKLVQTALLLVIVGSLVGIVAPQWNIYVAFPVVGIGVLLLMFSFVYGWKTAAGVNKSFAEALEDAAPALRKGLQEGYVDRVRAYYNGFTPMFESMRRLIADARADVIPQQKVASQLYLRLKALEQEI